MSDALKLETGTEEEGLANSPLRIASAMTWQFAAVGAYMPFLPLYFSSMGIGSSGIALLMAVQSATVLLVSQGWGYLSDQFFRRTTLMMAMSLGAALMQGLYPRLPGVIPWLALGLVFHEMFFAPRVALLNSLALESRGGERAFGRIRIAGSLSFAVAAPAVGWLADNPLFTVAVMWPVLVCFEVLYALSMAGLVDDTPAERRSRGRVQVSFREAQRTLLSNPVILRFLVFLIILQVAHFPGLLLQIPYMEQLGATKFFITICLSTAALAEITVFFFGHQLLSRIRLMPLMLLIPFGLMIRWVMVFAHPTLAMMWVSHLMHFVTFGLAYLVCIVFMNREAPHHLRSSGQTLLAITFSSLPMVLGNVAASALIWLLKEKAGLTELAALRCLYVVSFGVAGLSILAWLPLCRAFNRKHQVRGFWVHPAS